MSDGTCHEDQRMEGLQAGSAVARRSSYLTTSIYAERQRLAFWQDVIRRHLSPSEFKPTGRQIFNGELRQVALGNASLCDVTFAPVVNTRDSACIKKLPDEDFFVCLMEKGSGQVEQNERSAKVGDGDIVIYESAKPFVWKTDTSARMIVARVPRTQMLSRLPNVGNMTARVINVDKPFASLIAHTMREFLSLNEDLEDSVARRLGSCFLDTLTVAVEASLLPRMRGLSEEDLLTKSKKFLRNNLDNSEFEFEDLANHAGVSLRTIARAFATDGTTPAKWLWQARLEMAKTLLVGKSVDSVSAAAMQCGFNDFSHFSRAFKTAYGVAPVKLFRTP